MNEHLTEQIVSAMLRDGSVSIDAARLREKVEEAVAGLGKEYVFRGIVTPSNSAGAIFKPTVVVAMTGGTYRGFSSLVIDQFTAAMFTTDDGGEWTKTVIYNLIDEKIDTPVVDFDNLPTFDSVTGHEKVIVEKDGRTGLVTLTQIRQVVLPGYTYEDLSMDKFPIIQGGISTEGRFNSTYTSIEIPIKTEGAVFVISVSGTGPIIARNFAFTKESITNGVITYCESDPGFHNLPNSEPITIFAPEDAAYLVMNKYITAGGSTGYLNWTVQVGDLIINTRLNELEERTATIENAIATPPYNTASAAVSREEFEELKRRLDGISLSKQ